MRQVTTQAISFGLFAAAMVVLMVATEVLPATAASDIQATGVRLDLTNPDLLHIQADHVWTSPQGAVTGRRQTEFWFDPAAGAARLVEQRGDPAASVVYIRSGRTYTTLFAGQKRSLTHIAADDRAPYLRTVENMVLGYKGALDQGQLRSLGEEAVQGGQALRVQVTARGNPPSITAPAAGAVMDVIEAYLDKANGLPLREVVYRQVAGTQREVERHSITYRRVERLGRSTAPADLFSPTPPADWDRTITEDLTAASAAAFKEFDLYWLGPNFGGLPLFGTAHNQVVRANGRLSNVNVTYAPPFINGQQAPGQLSIVQRPPLTAEEIASRARRGAAATGEALTVGGRSATLYSAGAGRVQLELTIGNTFVTVNGADRAQVVQAAGALRRLT